MRSGKRRDAWDERWASDGYRPRYEIGSADPTVQAALEEGWFRPGMRAIDIGCGAGHNAIWLAQQGLTAVGVDFAPSAIRRAAARLGEVPRLSFEVVDVTKRGRYSQTFDVLVDRGCFHGIDRRSRPAYAENVTFWARPGARFLLIARTKGVPIASVVADTRQILARSFDAVSFSPCDVAGPDSDTDLPAVAMRFVRRATDPAGGRP